MCMKVGECLLRDFIMGRGKELFFSCLFLTIHLTDYPLFYSIFNFTSF